MFRIREQIVVQHDSSSHNLIVSRKHHYAHHLMLTRSIRHAQRLAETDHRAWTATLALFIDRKLTVYDAAYLQSAKRRGPPAGNFR
jgi:hypothetical protein